MRCGSFACSSVSRVDVLPTRKRNVIHGMFEIVLSAKQYSSARLSIEFDEANRFGFLWYCRGLRIVKLRSAVYYILRES